MSHEPILELSGVTAGYGPFRALFDVSLSVPEGGAVALLGANGAGKTTVARVASGLVKPLEGSVDIAGREVTGKPTYHFARSGIVHAPEGRSVFSTFTVEENLALPFGRTFSRKGVPAALERAYEIFPQLGNRRKQIAGTLSGGEQRMLCLARALVESPKLLIADELSLGLAPIIVDQVYDLLEKIREAGTAVLVVEQHVGHALDLCDHVILLTHGEISWEGPSDEARHVVASTIFGSPGTD